MPKILSSPLHLKVKIVNALHANILILSAEFSINTPLHYNAYEQWLHFKRSCKQLKISLSLSPPDNWAVATNGKEKAMKKSKCSNICYYRGELFNLFETSPLLVIFSRQPKLLIEDYWKTAFQQVLTNKLLAQQLSSLAHKTDKQVLCPNVPYIICLNAFACKTNRGNWYLLVPTTASRFKILFPFNHHFCFSPTMLYFSETQVQ